MWRIVATLIRRHSPWRGLEDVEFATLTWVAWYNGSRLHESLGYESPAGFEKKFHASPAATAAALT
jgi:putative transposase